MKNRPDQTHIFKVVKGWPASQPFLFLGIVSKGQMVLQWARKKKSPIAKPQRSLPPSCDQNCSSPATFFVMELS
jgi:hypothetical protein